MLPLDATPRNDRTHWFSATGCVVERDGRFDVFVGGSLIGTFEAGETGVRNVLVVSLASDPHVHLGRLAEAFGMTSETLRLLRRLYESRGMGELWGRARGGSHPKFGPSVRARLRTLFEQGASVAEAHAQVARRRRISRRTVERARARWAASRREAVPGPVAAEPAGPFEQLALPAAANDGEAAEAGATEPKPPTGAQSQEAGPSDSAERAEVGSPEEDGGAEVTIAPAPVRGGRFVQHVGGWLLLGMLRQIGLYEQASRVCAGRADGGTLRVALDAAVLALGVGQRCIEGVRRLGTPTAPRLLRAERAPSASWVRRVLGRLAADEGGPRLQMAMATHTIEMARAMAEGPATVFYVDNHLRPYTGKHVVRRGWRMQDRRVRPGTTDYYVHDEEGTPVLRLPVPSHDSLTAWLGPVARLLREALGEEEKILLVFDRAGAFPEQMAELREQGFDFLTYERRPFPMLSAAAFDRHVTLDGERIEYAESRINLRAGRGRVWRIATRMSDGRQVNLLTVSRAPASWLIGVMRGRWNQENGFKHGIERWGINQLDGRRTRPYPPETIVPNPARRRLDRLLRLARVREGLARRELARLGAEDRRRVRWELEVSEAEVEQQRLEALRPSTPKRAALSETELAGTLVQHTTEYKTTLDTLRVACANVETDLTGHLAARLNRPAEAKKALANLLAAPGNVHLGARTIHVTLLPAGNTDEQAAYRALLTQVNGWELRLPGDPARRRLVFRSQIR